MTQYLDIDGWKRRDHFRLFLDFAQPFFSVTVQADVTSLWERCRRPDAPSFHLASLFACLQALNATEAMRLRLRGDRVVVHERVGLGTTVLRSDETFGFAFFELTDDFSEFAVKGRKAMQTVVEQGTFDPAHDRDDLVYHSTLPWFRFTSFSNALPGRDSIPRIVFGRCSADGAAWRLPLAVEVHHSLADGLDVARFIERFEQAAASLEF